MIGEDTGKQTCAGMMKAALNSLPDFFFLHFTQGSSYALCATTSTERRRFFVPRFGNKQQNGRRGVWGIVLVCIPEPLRSIPLQTKIYKIFLSTP